MKGIPIIILGAGGHAKVVISTLQAEGRRIEGCFDDNSALIGQDILGIPVLGKMEDALQVQGRELIIGIGDNLTRKKLAERFSRFRFARAIHPSSWVHPSVEIGLGSVVFANTAIQPDSKIGVHAIINTGASIDHDCQIGDYVHLAPGAVLCGGVEVGEGSFMGVRSAVLPSKKIGTWATLGGGAVVVQDVPPHVTAVGVPTRIIKRKS